MVRYRFPFALLALVFVSGPSFSQTTWWVDASGSPPGSGTVNDPYTEIGFALSAMSTVDGDTLQVRPGLYAERDLDFAGKAVRIVSTDGPASTIVDAGGQGSCFLFRSGEDASSRLEGLTLRDGGGTSTVIQSSTWSAGGGVFVSGASPSFSNCRFELHARADFGGGAFLESSSATFVDCEFRSNGGYKGGGAATFSSAALFEGCTFGENGRSYSSTPQEGGGLYAVGTAPRLRDCDFVDNTAARGGAIAGLALVEDSYFEGNIGQFGGAVFGGFSLSTGTVLERCELNGNFGLGFTGEDGFGGGAFGAVLRDCQLLRNVASSGGGVNQCQVLRCVFIDNRAVEFENDPFAATGGGAASSELVQSMFIGNETELFTFNGGVPGAGGGAWLGSAERCVFFDNLAGIGGGVFGTTLDRCTVVRNTADTEADGAYDATVSSSILWNNGEELGAGSIATYSNIEGGFAGVGNVDVDPLFVDASGGDLHLLAGSPVIDLGDPAAPRDFDQTRADMGAFPASDCNDNLTLDADDILGQTSVDANANGFPDECECKAESVCESSINSAGSLATIQFGGSVSIAANDLSLIANDCPPNRSGLFFYGVNGVSVPFGDGVRCVGGQVFRFAPIQTNSQGIAVRAIDNTQPPGAAGQLVSGSVWFFQFYYRDPGGPGGTGFNLTDAVRARFCD